jgi:hypothetical protein
LFARAAGRCEFDGCNRLVIEHHVTKEAGNYGERLTSLPTRQQDHEVTASGRLRSMRSKT